MKTLYIEKMDKHRWLMQNIQIKKDDCRIFMDLEKEKNIRKIIKRLVKMETTNVVLSKEIYKNKNFINALNANSIKIFDGRWLEKYLAIQILDYIIIQKNLPKEQTEIAITVNQITDLSIEIIKRISKQYKKLTIITNHIEKLLKIEKEIYDKEGILIIVSNNKKKSLLRAQIVLNIDFNKELLNKYKIKEDAIIINLEGDMKIEQKRFNGINVNDYEILVGKEEVIWRINMKKFRTKDLLEAVLYMKDTFGNICSKISNNKVSINELYGINGKIERFS